MATLSVDGAPFWSFTVKKKVTINWWRFWLGNLLGGDKMTGVIGKIEHSAGYYLRCILMERMEKLYKALKNTDNPHGL